MVTLPKTLSKFLWHFIKKYKGKFLILQLIALFWGIHLSITPYLMKVIIDIVSEYSDKPDQLITAALFPAAIYVFMFVLLAVVFRVYDYVMLKTFPPMKADMISSVYDYLEKHSYSYFQQNFSGSLANKITDISKGAETLLTNGTDVFVASSLSLLVGAITMYLVHPYFAITLSLWIFSFMGISIFCSQKSQKYSRIASESRSTLMGKVVDSITNILNIKLFSQGCHERRYLRKYLKDAVEKDQHLHWYLLKLKAFQGGSIALLVGLMTWLLLDQRAKNNITVGDFALILSLSLSIVQEVFYMAKEWVNFSELIGSCQQALSIITTPHEIVDKPGAKSLVVTKGEIVFDNVEFHYIKGVNLFKDKSIIIPAGKKVGLVGFSGSGKTTFVNLIMRFFEINSGQILIDGQSIASVTQESLRKQIAMIPQDPILFHRGLMENIRYGRLDATDAEVIEASEKAHCHEFIMKLKEGYNTLVGEKGMRLSGGQKQRIAIARAILKKAPILILDEATSALDTVTERQIQESLDELMFNTTTIVIAHRLSTLANLDCIFVFKDGRIVEHGSHDELLNIEGHYATLWNMQTDGFIPDVYENVPPVVAPKPQVPAMPILPIVPPASVYKQLN